MVYSWHSVRGLRKNERRNQEEREGGGGERERARERDCINSPNLFNVYIDELARSLKHSCTPGLTLSDKDIECLLFADYLIVLSLI